MMISAEFIQIEETTQVSPLAASSVTGPASHKPQLWKDLIWFCTCGIKKGFLTFFNAKEKRKRKEAQISSDESVRAHCPPLLACVLSVTAFK